MVTELRVGIVGAGLIAGVHLNAYGVTPGTRVVGVADPVGDKAARLAGSVGAKAVATIDQLIDVGVDVVSICTPPSTHADLTIRALDAGLDVLCEKPIARTLEDGRRIMAAAERAPGLLMVGHVSRFEPDHRHAKHLVDQGQLGRVQMMSHSITTCVPGWSESGWLADAEQSGGPLVDLSVHSFDFLSWVADSAPVRITAVGADTAAGPATYALVTVRYASGAMALVEASWAHPVSRGFKLATELVGTEGRLNWSYDHMMGGVMYVREGDTTWFDSLGDRGFRAELRTFTEAIRSGGPSPVPAVDGFNALRTALAALESIRTGATIDLKAWGV